MTNHYQLLEVHPSCTIKEIKKSYHRLCKKFHPDVNGGSKEHEEKLKLIIEAYEVLSDDISRKAYDEKLAAEKAAKLRFEKQQAEIKKVKEFNWFNFFSRAAIFVILIFLVAAVINEINKNLKS
jgi:DnaJ-class molecular chaperone